MLYQDVLNSNEKPSTYKNYYEKMTEPKISTQGDKKMVEAKITWNKKEYTFKWCTKLSDEEIKKQLGSKVDTMLSLAIRYDLGEKTTSIKYNLNDQTVERRKGSAQPKISVLNFNAEAKRVADKISALPDSPEKKAKLEKLQYRQNRITWTQKMFANLGNSIIPVPKHVEPYIEINRADNETTPTNTTTTTSATRPTATTTTTTTTATTATTPTVTTTMTPIVANGIPTEEEQRKERNEPIIPAREPTPPRVLSKKQRREINNVERNRQVRAQMLTSDIPKPTEAPKTQPLATKVNNATKSLSSMLYDSVSGLYS